ncbi:hypothetical protein A8F94_18705 [Bacillus sp. FJAT-27225]|uniref:hypothetical protein n=1 Tax=Bacillus sp. FJAT-27225 TaxID=1743144 RepID=UPI00080C3395|nr:hypothetical protein [Bacillus sp. FJAT-27225]OCA83157.1 hypothetical protein A8F94_18705 [Bacillus sp. FJAT-27225]
MKKALKMIGLIFIGFILGFMVAPSGEDSTATVKEVVEQEDVASAETEKPIEEAAKAEEKAPVPVPVFEDDRVLISFLALESKGVKFLVENKTDVNITIQADSVAVNGFSANDITMSDDIAPKSKGFAVAKTSQLADVGTPEKVSGSLTVIDFDYSFDSYSAKFTDVAVQ